jgi:serine/threonine-protein kinase
MASMEGDIAEAVRNQIGKILASEGFARNDRLSNFLKFVVEQELSGSGNQLKESIIGVEVFGRRPDYDVRQDSVVRTEAVKLRARLTKYYASEATASRVIIELPKGGYRPVFRESETSPDVERPASISKERTAIRWAIAAIASVLLSLAAIGLWWVQHQPAPISIAVLPLINLSADPADDYFVDGLTGEIIRNLSIIDGLAVRSQTSSFVFKGKQQNVREAGKLLNAEYILEGQVLRSGQQLRINAALVRMRDDFPLWSARYDEELTDVFAIQDKISRGIVNSLRLKLGRGRRRYETNAEAYDLYLRGRAFELQPGLTGMTKSIGPFEQAIAKDPGFAPAHAGLADAYVALSGFDSDLADRADQDRADQISRMRAAAEKALQLDPLLAEAHSALAMVYAREAQWDQSGKSFRRAIDLDPSGSLPRTQFARNLLLPLSRIEEAIAQLLLAEKSDPLSPDVRRTLVRFLLIARRFDEVATRCPKPCVEALVLQGRAAEAIPFLEARFRGDLSASGSGTLGRAYALAGRREDAERVAAAQWRPIPRAGIFMALGDKNRAIESLERAVPLGPVRLGRALADPEFASLRGDPRVKALRKKVGLPD